MAASPIKAPDVQETHAPSLIGALEASGVLPPETLARARLVHEESGERYDAILTRLGLMSEQSLADFAARHSGLPILEQSQLPQVRPEVGALSLRWLRDNRVLPLSITDQSIDIAVVDPFDSHPEQALEFMFRRPVRRWLARASDLETFLDRHFAAQRNEDGDVAIEADEADLERLQDLASDAPAIRAVNRLITQAVEQRASDIHVEPTEEQLKVRMRIDGAMLEQDPLPASMKAAFVSRVKVMSGLNIAEKRLPQDGRLRLAVRGHDVDLRVATAPTIHGESVVMRLLDRSNLTLDLATLGFDPPTVKALTDLVHQPHGIVLVTGPTGSGKTTTLYATLSLLNASTRKILTVEDPVEYRLAGINQTQVSPPIGLTFAAALRSFLRQDPDVMMVGEIRDLETAQVAVQASLTGHMILSTLHTNTAAGAVTRLIDMGVEPFLIASTVSAVLAQRLVRRLCPHCRQPHQADHAVLRSLGFHVKEGARITLYQPVGCASCNGSGFRGRIAIHELLRMDEKLSQMVVAHAEARDIQRQAVSTGMHTMLQDGLIKSHAGLTTIEEVVRVTREG